VAYDLEEQEQIEALKAWWNKYSNALTAVVAVVALGVLSYNGWNWYQTRQSQGASALFDQLQQAIDTKNAVLTREVTGVLLDKYNRTSYAEMAALLAARANVDAGDLKTASAQLQWAADHAADDSYRWVAKLRRAGVLLDQGQPDAALVVLSGDVPPAFKAAFDDRRGDVYVSQNKPDLARAQYQDALAALPLAGSDAQSSYTGVIQLKLDALASATIAATVPAPPTVSTASHATESEKK